MGNYTVWKMGKRLFTIVVMGIPLWVAIAGLHQFSPASLVVHLEESDVRLFLDGREYPTTTGMIGPIDLKPGEYRMLVMRREQALFSYPISLEEGVSKEVWAHWKTGGAATLRESGIRGAFHPAAKDLKERSG